MINVNIEGIDDLIHKMSKLNWRETINTAIKKSIALLERQSKIETPVDTGTLRNSYKEEFEDLIGRLVNFREYWIYVHEWREFYKWNPFMQRAVEKTDGDIEMIFSREYDSLLAQLQ